MAVTATLGSPTLASRGGDIWTVAVPVTYTSGAVELEETVSATVNASNADAGGEFARIIQSQVEARIATLERQIVLTPIAAAIVVNVQAALDGE